MIEYQKIHHVSLNVRNLAAAKKFYMEVLRFQEIERPNFNSNGVWFAIGDSGQQLHLIEYTHGHSLRDGGIDLNDGHFAIWVKSYKATIEWLEQSGIVFDARPNSAAGFAQIYINDIDCNIIEFDADLDI
ncbi:MAG TPA: VOC family protein [Bacilli bacterium]